MSTLSEYQARVRRNLEGSQRPLVILSLMLLLEAGEFGNEVKRIHTRDGGELTDARWSALVLELGDLFYYFCAIMDYLSVDLDTVMELNTNKLNTGR